MAVNLERRDNLQEQLKKKRICRFCLTQEKLSNIFARIANETVRLPIQIMACASIEVFPDDGMPMWICKDCRIIFEQSYRFKQMCKQADTLLRQFPLTGEWPEKLERPHLPQSDTQIKKINTANKVMSPVGVRKILNSSPAVSPEPPIPKRMVIKTDSLTLDDHLDEILMRVGDYDELSMDDVQRLIANADDNGDDSMHVVLKTTASTQRAPPKILNKESKRLHNKEVNIPIEPNFSQPEVKVEYNGTVSIVTAILDPNENYEPQNDVTKDVIPVITDVYPCPHCDRSFPLVQLRDIHMVNHNRERKFPCNVCQKSFFNKYDLQKHEVRHKNEKPFPCVVCHKTFSRAALLNRHERTHTDIPKLLCVHCEKSFISKEDLERHTMRHERNRPYQCRTCNKSFAFKQGLERHEVVHSAVQPYPCQYCNHSFPTPSKLARHLTAHAGKRPYPCKYCSKSYMLSHHLTRHLRSHKEENTDHFCSVCKTKFKLREDLIYHTTIHALTNMECSLCHKKFKLGDDLEIHIKQHVDGESNACEFCDMMFITSQELEEHCHKTHVEDMAAYNDDGGIEVDDKHIIFKNSKIVDFFPTKNKTIKSADRELEKTLQDIIGDDDKITIEDEEFIIEEIGQSQNIKIEQPQIINQIVIKSTEGVKKGQSEKKEKQMSLLSKQIEKEISPPSAKMRKVISSDGHIKSVSSQSKQSLSSQTVSPNRRQEVAPATPITKIKIKTEKEDNLPPVLEKILPRLPKGVTLRRTINKNKNQTLISKEGTKPIQQEETKSKPVNITDDVKPTTSLKDQSIKMTNASEENKNSMAKTSNSTVKEKHAKGKIIRTNRSPVEASTKQSRNRFKDGNMSLASASRANKGK